MHSMSQLISSGACGKASSPPTLPHPSTHCLSTHWTHTHTSSAYATSRTHSPFITMFITWLKLPDYAKKATDYGGLLSNFAFRNLQDGRAASCSSIPFDTAQADADWNARSGSVSPGCFRQVFISWLAVIYYRAMCLRVFLSPC